MTDYIADLTPEFACETLRPAGLFCSPDEIQIVAREARWAVMLPGERIAWFPASESGSRRLAVERCVLRLVANRCSFRVPRTLFLSEAGFEVRQMVPGRCDPWGLFERCKRDSGLAQRVGRSLGGILAEQHTGVGEAEVTGWLPRRVAWPERSDWIRERLPGVVDDDDLIVVMERTIERYEAVAVDADDCVLVHGDVGLHNLAFEAETDTVNGIFDYDSAAWADRHHDFRYLLFRCRARRHVGCRPRGVRTCDRSDRRPRAHPALQRSMRDHLPGVQIGHLAGAEVVREDACRGPLLGPNGSLEACLGFRGASLFRRNRLPVRPI
jgi:hypothetical protein